MRVKFIGELSRYPDIDLEVDNLMLLLSGLKLHYGQGLADTLLNDRYYYLLADSKDPEHIVSIHPDLITMNFGDFDTLLVVPEVEGDGPAILAAVAPTLVGTLAGAAIIVAIDVVISIAISIALNAIMNLLSPTPEFSADPAAAQKLDSALFNGAPNIREQGGSVPLIYGTCHAGGVLISAGLSTEEKTV